MGLMVVLLSLDKQKLVKLKYTLKKCHHLNNKEREIHIVLQFYINISFSYSLNYILLNYIPLITTNISLLVFWYFLFFLTLFC